MTFYLLIFCISIFSNVSAFAKTTLQQSIIYSKHNLSAQGPGTMKAQTESEVCIFCHTPHNATGQAPLWNRYESAQIYLTYSSSTAKASIGQPTGASKLCLSCHDGMVAIGMVRNRGQEIPFSGGMGVMAGSESNLGTNLSHEHPISFVYDSVLALKNTQLKNSGYLTGDVKLDKSGQMQCTSCHDPHHNDYGKFLVADGRFSTLCTSCHHMNGWEESVHRTSSAAWSGAGSNPWPHTSWKTVTENGCENCHRPHKAGSKERLLNFAIEESNCYSCHNGNVARKNIANEFRKYSRHPITDTINVHDPAEEALVIGARHVKCVDCHNPHAVNNQAGLIPGTLRKLKGIDRNGIAVKEIRYEYELCFRCHSDTNTSRVNINRQSPESNMRLAFDPSNASYHPVINLGKGVDVPSLISPYTTSSIIQCTSCHNNNSGPNNFGLGPNGPHGSDFATLLERQLITDDGQFESAQSYALCYKCHDRNSILNNQSFTKHHEHIVNQKTPCTACHDPHGVKNTAHLINFDRKIVQPNNNGILRYESTGRFAGRCFLKCHNSDHNPFSYGDGVIK